MQTTEGQDYSRRVEGVFYRYKSFIHWYSLCEVAKPQAADPASQRQRYIPIEKPYRSLAF